MKTIGATIGVMFGLGVAVAAHAAETSVKVGWCARGVTSAAAPFAIATKMGWYAEAGLKVELIPLPGSTDCMKMVATGELPFSMPSVEPLATLRTQGVKAKVFYTAYQGNIYGIAVPVDSPIKDAKDLKGKKIGVQAMASAGVQIARALLTLNGINPDREASIVAIGEAAQAATMVKNKQVDALSMYDTQYAIIANTGVELRRLDTGPIASFPSNGFTALETTLQKNRDQAVAIAKGYARGTVFAIANPEAAVRILHEVYPSTKPIGKTDADAVKDDVNAINARIPSWKLETVGAKRWGDNNVQAYDSYVKFLVEQSVVKAAVPGADLVTNDLVDDINKFDVAKTQAEAKAYHTH